MHVGTNCILCLNPEHAVLCGDIEDVTDQEVWKLEDDWRGRWQYLVCCAMRAVLCTQELTGSRARAHIKIYVGDGHVAMPPRE